MGRMAPRSPSHPVSMIGQRPSLRKAFTAFRNVHVRWLWACTLASFSAMQMQLIARGVLAWEISGSYAVVGIVEAAFALPMAIFSLPGGAAVDRVEKRRIVVFSQAVMCALALITAILVQTDLISIALLRSAARRVGEECVCKCRSRWSPY